MQINNRPQESFPRVPERMGPIEIVALKATSLVTF